MNITYLGNFNKPLTDATERHIKHAFEKLGHTVTVIDETEFANMTDDTKPEDRADVKALKKADMFLYHKAEIGADMLVKLLNYITCDKVCWYFDKVFPDREEYIEMVAAYSEHVVLTDDTFIRRHKFKNLSCIRQGIGNENLKPGKYRKEYDYDIVFTGNVYEGREDFARVLGERYGKKFKIISDAFGQDLVDLCFTARIVVAPEYPGDEFYWSSRIYQVLGSGGFLVHPDFYGLKEEFVEGKHFAGYKGLREMLQTIEYYLEHPEERKAIQEAGFKHCNSEYSYEKRVEELLKLCEKKK